MQMTYSLLLNAKRLDHLSHLLSRHILMCCLTMVSTEQFLVRLTRAYSERYCNRMVTGWIECCFLFVCHWRTAFVIRLAMQRRQDEATYHSSFEAIALVKHVESIQTFNIWYVFCSLPCVELEIPRF